MKPLLPSIVALTLASRGGEPAAPVPTLTPAREPSDWEFSLALYAPLMGLEGDIGVAGIAPNHVDIAFEDILDSLDAGLSGAFEARKGRWSATVDAIWLKLSTDADLGAASKLLLRQEQITATLTVGYEIYRDECTSFAVIAGAAYNRLDVDLELITPNLPVTSRSGSGSQEWIDPFVGLRFHRRLGERWSVFATGAYGGFGISSDEYWQAFAGFSYHLSDSTSLALAYRVIAVDYRQGGFVFDTETSGPNLGLVIRF